jgi:hypothetical protein
MRLLSYGKCIALLLLSAVVFGAGSLIAAFTTPDTGLAEWTRICAITAGKIDVKITCEDFERRLSASSEIVAMLQDYGSLTVTCSGYRTAGYFARISLNCGDDADQ